jgi:putative endonuclease
MLSSKDLGRAGEEFAEYYLKNLGYKILQKNFRCRLGEIDLIVKKDNILTFVEVKTRKSSSYGAPEESIDYLKINRIKNSAEYFISLRKLYDFDASFDVISIKLVSSKFLLKHIRNAF